MKIGTMTWKEYVRGALLENLPILSIWGENTLLSLTWANSVSSGFTIINIFFKKTFLES